MAASDASKDFVQKIFIAYFGRPAAPTGLEYYAGLLDANPANKAAIIDDFWNSAESQALYGGKTIEAQVTAVFQQLFGRDPAISGLTFWTSEIQAGRVSLPEAAAVIADSAAAADLAVFEAKVEAADKLTAAMDTAQEVLDFQGALDAARAALAGVTTADGATAFDGDAELANIIAGSTTGQGQTFTLTTGLDELDGTPNNDIFRGVIDGTTGAVATTITALDSIDGGAGVDTFRINVINGVGGAGTAVGSLPAITLTDVENASIRTAVDLTADLSTYSGLESVTVTETLAGSDIDLTAGSGAAVSVSGATGAITTSGGASVSITQTDRADGGADQDIDISGSAGPVVVTSTGVAYSAAQVSGAMGAISVDGGSSISITQSTTSDDSAAATDPSAATVTQGNVAVTGGATTTDVTVIQDAENGAENFEPVVAFVAATQEVTFSALTAGQTAVVFFGGGDFLQFQAVRDLTAQEVAEAFANLSKDDAQGSAPASDGIYSDGDVAGDGDTNGWASGPAVSVNATTSRVVFSNVDNHAPAGLGVGGSVPPVAAAVVNGVDGDSGDTGELGVVAGAVTIKDSAAQTIETVTLASYGASSRIGGAAASEDTSKLATLTLSNADDSVGLSVDDTADTLTLSVSTLGNQVTRATTGLGFVDAPTTLNVTATGTNYIALTADQTETLTVGGSGLLDVDANDLAALQTVTVKDSASLSLNAGVANTVTSVDTTATSGTVTVTIAGDAATYAGGAGSDRVSISNPATAISKEINLAGGDDVFDVSASDTPATPTQEVLGGAGTDTLLMSSNGAEAASGGSTFEGGISGFEKLSVEAVQNGESDEINLANLDDIGYVITGGAADVVLGSPETQTFVITAGIDETNAANDAVREQQTLDFTGVAVSAAGSGDITVGGLTVTLANSDDSTQIATAVAAALNGAQPAGTTENVFAKAIGSEVTIIFDSRDGDVPELLVANTDAVLVGTATLPAAATQSVAHVGTTGITVGPETVLLDRPERDAASEAGAQVAATGDLDPDDVGNAIVAALNGGGGLGTFSTVSYDAGTDTVTVEWAANGDQPAVNLIGSRGVAFDPATDDVVQGVDDGVTGDQLFTNLSSGATLEITDTANQTEVRLSGYDGVTDATGASDSANIALSVNGNAGTVIMDKIESVSISVVDSNPSPVAVSTDNITLDADSATSIDVSGGGLLNLTLSAATVNVEEIDASGMTQSFTVTTLAGDAGPTKVIGGSDDDTLTARGANDELIGGAGDDTLIVLEGTATELTGGAGDDLFDVSNYSGTVGGAPTITDFSAGEKIKFASDSDAVFVSGQVELIEESTFTEFVAEAMKVASNDGVRDFGVAWFQFNGNTFIVQNEGFDSSFDEGVDQIVRIQGLFDLSNSSFNDQQQGTLQYIA